MPAQCIKCGKDLPEAAAFCPSCGKKQIAGQRPKKKRSHANGIGTVYKSGKSWYCEKTLGWEQNEDGTKRRVFVKKGGFRTASEATDFLPHLQALPGNISPDITFRQLYEQWLPHHSAQVGRDTMNCYKAAYKYFQPLYYIHFREIKTAALQECLDACEKGKRTKQNMKALGTLLWDYAMQNDVVDKNYAKFLVVNGETGTDRQPFSAEQLAAMFEKRKDIPDLEHVLRLCYTGLRINEYLTIPKSELHRAELKDGGTVWYIVGGSKTDAGKNRIVTIAPQIEEGVLEMSKGEGDLLFTPSGKPMSAKKFRDEIYYPALEAAGLPRLVPHCCRHTFVTMMKDVDAPAEDKMKLAGHSDAKTARRYTHADIDALAKISQQLLQPASSDAKTE